MRKLNLQYFAEEPKADDNTPAAEPKKPETTEPKSPEKQEPNPIPYDRFKEVNDNLKAWKSLGFDSPDAMKNALEEFNALKDAEEKRKKAEMSEQDRLQAEKEEAENRAKESEERANQTLTKANKRLMKSEFRLLAKEIGVRGDALDDAFVLADLTAAAVDDEGNVQGVKDALEALKEKKSYLFASKTYADPSPGNTEPKRDNKESMKKKLDDLAETARKTGRIEDKIAYSRLKKELGI
jgi:hypothetical protein